MTPDPLVVLNGRPPATGITPITTEARSLRVTPEAVATAREFTRTMLTGALPTEDLDHIYDVSVVVSELVGNAFQHARNIKNAWLEIEVWSKWTLVTVDDRDPQVHSSTVNGDELAESGRGLKIVESLSARFWWRYGLISKTANAVILRPGVKPTKEDNALLDRLETDG